MKSKMKIVLICATAMLLSGCATNGVDSFCSIARPIYTDSHADMLSDSTARAIYDHNSVGKKQCGWKPHKGV